MNCHCWIGRLGKDKTFPSHPKRGDNSQCSRRPWLIDIHWCAKLGSTFPATLNDTFSTPSCAFCRNHNRILPENFGLSPG